MCSDIPLRPADGRMGDGNTNSRRSQTGTEGAPTARRSTAHAHLDDGTRAVWAVDLGIDPQLPVELLPCESGDASRASEVSPWESGCATTRSRVRAPAVPTCTTTVLRRLRVAKPSSSVVSSTCSATQSHAALASVRASGGCVGAQAIDHAALLPSSRNARSALQTCASRLRAAHLRVFDREARPAKRALHLAERAATGIRSLGESGAMLHARACALHAARSRGPQRCDRRLAG